MNGVGGARRNELHINECPCRPGVTLVDGIAMLVDALRTVEMRAFLNRPPSIIVYAAAPEENLTLVVGGFQFHPDIEAVDSTSGKEMSNLARAHYDIHTFGIATP